MTTAMAGTLRPELEALVGPSQLVTGRGLDRYRLGDLEPSLAVRPADEGEVSRVLALAHRERLAVVPWGSGLHQSLGHPPARYDLALDLARLDRVVDHQPGDMTVTVQPGVRLGALAELLGRHSQFLPLDPPRGEASTVGGLLATNLSGPLRCRYGTARDLVLGLRVVHADGAVTAGGGRVVKNVSAYDIPKLYLGAHGTLGVIVEATLRIYPRAQAEGAAACAFPHPSAAQALADRLLHSALVPTRLELLDGGVLPVQGAPPLLVATFAGVPAAVTFQQETVRELAASCDGRSLDLPDLPGAMRRLTDFPWAPVEAGSCRVLWRGGVLPADCAKAMEAVRAAAGPDGAARTVATVSAGVLRGLLGAEEPGHLLRTVRAARRALESLGGYLVILDAPAAVRAAADVWGPPPPSHPVMRQLRAAFDERSVLNPGRFVGAL